mgnify:CR=1 FL=1
MLDAPTQSGLLRAARGVLTELVVLGHTRLQLASTELEEERLRLVNLLVYAVAALFCLGLGLVLGSVLTVVLLWDTHRVLALASLTALFLLFGVSMAWVGYRKSACKPRVLSATIDALQRDAQALRHFRKHSS